MNRNDYDAFGLAPNTPATTRGLRAASLRPLLLSASLVLALVAAPAGAAEEQGSGAASTGAASSTAVIGQTVEKMQENVRKMQSQLDRIAAAKTDEERRDALAEHMRTMQANMMMGRNMMMGAAGGCPMMGGGTMGPGMMGGGMMGRGGSGVPGPAEMERMERRLDMMQMMLEQMRARQAQPGTAPSTPGQ